MEGEAKPLSENNSNDSEKIRERLKNRYGIRKYKIQEVIKPGQVTDQLVDFSDFLPTTLEAVQAAEQLGLTVSCDLNFRKKLWRWRPEVEPAKLAQQTMREILQHVEIVIANEEDAAVVLDIHAGDSDIESGKLAIDKYPTVAREIVRQFSHVTRVAITLRESISASHNRWGAMLYDARQDQACFAPLNDGQYCPYEITNIVDRVGAGDSFAAGLIYASCTSGLDVPTDTLAFATAGTALVEAFWSMVPHPLEVHQNGVS